MKHPIALIALAGMLALPALAQMSPAQTNLDPKAAAMERRNAHGAQLRSVSADQALTNGLQRCANLPPYYKSDCEARVRGQGQASGSVVGGGMVRESVTSMPQSELDAQMQGYQPMTPPTAPPKPAPKR